MEQDGQTGTLEASFLNQYVWQNAGNFKLLNNYVWQNAGNFHLDEYSEKKRFTDQRLVLKKLHRLSLKKKALQIKSKYSEKKSVTDQS